MSLMLNLKASAAKTTPVVRGWCESNLPHLSARNWIRRASRNIHYPQRLSAEIVPHSWLGDADGFLTTGAIVSSSLAVMYSATLGVASSSPTLYPSSQSQIIDPMQGTDSARLSSGASAQGEFQSKGIESQKQQQQVLKGQQGAQPVRSAIDAESDGFQWGLMGVLSFLPLFNWMSWVLAGISDDRRAPLYYSLAALYSLPLLRSGFEIDGFAVGMLLLGILHVQVERLGRTEPDTLRNIELSALLSGVVRPALKGAGGMLGSVTEVVAEDVARKLVEDGKERASELLLPTKQLLPGQAGTREEAERAARTRELLTFNPSDPDPRTRSEEQRQMDAFDRQMRERAQQRKGSEEQK